MIHCSDHPLPPLFPCSRLRDPMSWRWGSIPTPYARPTSELTTILPRPCAWEPKTHSWSVPVEETPVGLWSAKGGTETSSTVWCRQGPCVGSCPSARMSSRGLRNTLGGFRRRSLLLDTVRVFRRGLILSDLGGAFSGDAKNSGWTSYSVASFQLDSDIRVKWEVCNQIWNVGSRCLEIIFIGILHAGFHIFVVF